MKLTISNISKHYNSKIGIHDINFEINSGECVGLIGHNGAGKTTLLRVLATLLVPGKGNIKFDDLNIFRNQIKYREILGYMPEEAELYKRYSAFSNLEFYSKFYKTISKNDILRFLKEFDVPNKKKVGTFSHGMRQKVLFLKAIMHNPKVLLLDEPLNTLDPSMRIKIKDILRKEQSEGKIIIISSHILSELQEICDRFIILKAGKIILDKNKNNISKDKTLEDVYKGIMND